MARLAKWLRPPRNLVIFFAFVVCIPAITLVALGIRLLDQDRALASQRQLDLLDRAADQAVRVLGQDLATRMKRLASEDCTMADVPSDAVCIGLLPDRIEVIPAAGRLSYYPVARRLREMPAEPFQELEANEFRQPIQLDQALAISRQLAASLDDGIRAGALLREARVLRKMAQPDNALVALSALSRITAISINGEPVDLLARRTRCAIFEDQSQTAELRTEASAIAADLRAGRWQLDRETFFHIDDKLHSWLGTSADADPADGQALAAAASWLYEHWIGDAERHSGSSGTHILDADHITATVLWSFANGRGSAFIAGPQYLRSHWLGALEDAIQPAQADLQGPVIQRPRDAPYVLRASEETGLPWTVMVSSGLHQHEPPEFAARRRNLMTGLVALILLIAAGGYLTWRAVNRELAGARLQSDFVSAVSHEFRTPLTALRQFNEMLTEADGPTADTRRVYYQAQSRATERLHRLVESLLDFGRMEAGRRPYGLHPMDAATLTRDVTDEFLREARSLGFSVTYTADRGPHPISADAEALARALWNLLDNAVKYSGDSRDIRVQVTQANGSVSIAVSDDGIGIPSSEHQTVFHKFVRGSASTSGGIQGTGLGLAMVQHIVQAHGGNVHLESAEGHGSTFTILLPAVGQRTRT